MFQLRLSTLFAIVALFALATAGELQIGITKKVSFCPRKAQNKDVVSVHYTGKLAENGEVFDSSITRGQPITFPLGAGRVIKGWDQGVLGMCIGEKRKLSIPSELGYGSRGAGGVIPPNADLVFDVELMAIDGYEIPEEPVEDVTEEVVTESQVSEEEPVEGETKDEL